VLEIVTESVIAIVTEESEVGKRCSAMHVLCGFFSVVEQGIGTLK